MKLRCPKCGKPVSRGGTSERGVQRYRCRSRVDGCQWNGTRPVGPDPRDTGVDSEQSHKLHKRIRSAKGVKRYVITAAQNATPVHKPFLEPLLTYCKDRRATLIVVPYRYKNPTSIWSAKAQHEDWWAPEVVKHLLDRRTDLNAHLTLLADIKTQPTASSPLTGFETVTGPRSAIVGHPKLALKSVATPQQKLPKLLTTTGAVTVPNYIPSKAGKKGEHHHTFGACVVEIAGDTFHMRQINAMKNGSFIELDREYRGSQVTKVEAAALVMGDTHQEFVDPLVSKATFDGPGSIVHTLKPKTLVWHDVHDFYSRNHHHRGEVFINYVKHHTGRANVERALDETFAFIDEKSPPWAVNVFVPSNHPDALARWIKETDPRTDPENCVFWAKTFEAMCIGAEWRETGARTIDPFAYWGRKKLKTIDRCVFLERGESSTVRGIEVGYHGDKGANGARGSVKSYSQIGVKTVTGHGHAPAIDGGAYRVGMSALYGMEYTAGAPSSALQTHCVIYANGKRSLINIINGSWRA